MMSHKGTKQTEFQKGMRPFKDRERKGTNCFIFDGTQSFIFDGTQKKDVTTTQMNKEDSGTF